MHRKIAAVGDSHSLRCFENHPEIADSTTYFGYNKLDGKTAFKIRSHDRRVQKIISSIRSKHLIFSLGEVDVRIHIKYKSIQTGTPTDELIRNTAEEYTSYVQSLREKGFDIHIFNVIPTGDFKGAEFERWRQNLAYPFTTTFSERQSYTLQLNEAYRKNCAEKNIPFIDIYDHLVDTSGKRKKELVYDFAHLNAKTADILLANYSFHKNGSIG